MRIDVFFHWGAGDSCPALLSNLQAEVDTMSLELDRLTSDVTSLRGTIDSAVLLIQGLAALIRETQPTEEDLAALADSLEAQARDLAGAVAANPLP
jgi:hypothetical protein